MYSFGVGMVRCAASARGVRLVWCRRLVRLCTMLVRLAGLCLAYLSFVFDWFMRVLGPLLILLASSACV